MLRLVLLSILLVTIQGGLLRKRTGPWANRGRIVGGEDAQIEDFPYQISMQHFGSHRCGGSIVNPTKIVTAAHCVRSTLKPQLSIRAGSTYHNSGGVVIQVHRTFEHEAYNIPIWVNNDIGLLILHEPLVFGPGIQPIVLPPQDQIVSGGSLSTITGWGTLSEGAQTIPNNLQSVVVPIVDIDDCIAAYAAVGGIVSDVMICAGVEEGGLDACQGDSGGPLTVANLLQGIVSWGYGCARPGLPGVYTRAASFRDWIDRHNE